MPLTTPVADSPVCAGLTVGTFPRLLVVVLEAAFDVAAVVGVTAAVAKVAVGLDDDVDDVAGATSAAAFTNDVVVVVAAGVVVVLDCALSCSSSRRANAKNANTPGESGDPLVPEPNS